MKRGSLICALMPDHPITLGMLPEELQAEFIRRHREAFPDIWEMIPATAIIDELYAMDLREVIETRGMEC